MSVGETGERIGRGERFFLFGVSPQPAGDRAQRCPSSSSQVGGAGCWFGMLPGSAWEAWGLRDGAGAESVGAHGWHKRLVWMVIGSVSSCVKGASRDCHQADLRQEMTRTMSVWAASMKRRRLVVADSGIAGLTLGFNLTGLLSPAGFCRIRQPYIVTVLLVRGERIGYPRSASPRPCHRSGSPAAPAG